MGDIRLRQDILDELEYETRIDAANIGVTVDDGVVTLTGHVHSFAEKQGSFAGGAKYYLKRSRRLP